MVSEWKQSIASYCPWTMRIETVFFNDHGLLLLVQGFGSRNADETLIVSDYNTNNFDLTLQWRHNGRDSVSNHQPHDCLFNRLLRRRSKKTSKLRVIGLCAGNSTLTGKFFAQMASNSENVSIWWRHHDINRSRDTMVVRLCMNKSLQWRHSVSYHRKRDPLVQHR